MFTILVFPAALIFASTTYVRAQLAPRAERDLEVRERQLRGIGKVKRIENDIAQPRVTLGQVKEDYEGLQAANNALLKMLSQGNGLDYKLVEDSASEIKKRAGHLKSYMLILQMVRENENRRKTQAEIETEEIKGSILSLDAMIARLVENPIFRNFNKVLDADNSTKARDDLDDIIDLSEGIKRSAKRAMKARASR
ncbi:MAG: hypothetical protein ICV60_18855 [Pyrinomonadaceae bacterium]|nr:hypothetical protein [Pyrinomonadaceae bacterium]